MQELELIQTDITEADLADILKSCCKTLTKIKIKDCKLAFSKIDFKMEALSYIDVYVNEENWSNLIRCSAQTLTHLKVGV